MRQRLWITGSAVAIVFGLAALMIHWSVNLIHTGLGLSFNWLGQTVGFSWLDHLLPNRPSDPRAWLLATGWINSLKVILFGLFIATLHTIAADTARSSSNPLLRRLAAGYVALIRQVPWIQLCIVAVLFGFAALLINNLSVNLIRTGLGLSFNWLGQTAGFALAEHALPYSPSDSYAWALTVAWFNSLKVILSGLVLATFLGVSAGAARGSSDPLLRRLAAGYVALIRQVPLLLQLLFWYFVAFLGLPDIPIGGLIKLSNQGIHLLGLDLSVEFCAVLMGLTVFTGASIAEVVRGGINSVPRGQWEAYRSLGLSEGLGLRRIVLPQALPAILPALTSQYLNLAKNSTLAIAVGFADLYAVSDTTITQTGRAIEGFILLLVSFLLLNLLISGGMGLLNRVVLGRGARA